MPVTVILGGQWGDEGKGKIVSLFSRHADLVARFQGGPNAGHTITMNGQTQVFRMIPSGFFHAPECVLGNGMVLNVEQLMAELDALRHIGLSTDKIWISLRAHVILPSHTADEQSPLHQQIGTTKSGVGPAYTDKVHRSGTRIADLIFQTERFRALPAEYRRSIQPFITEYGSQCVETTTLLRQRLVAGKHLILEGAQGALLDVDHGHYPFVTSSNTTIGAACTGLGLTPRDISNVYLVASAYQTKVGGGPFPTKLPGSSPLVRYLQAQGQEIDPVTHQLRDCGWLDLVLLKAAVALNQPTGVILTKLDVLSGVSELKAATGYRLGKHELTSPPLLAGQLAKSKPTYTAFTPWSASLSALRQKQHLPQAVLTYLHFIAEYIECPIYGISVGPEELAYIPYDT